MKDALDAWPQGGVHRVLGAADPVAAELADRGWAVAVVPASTTDAGLWDGLAAGLVLPAWFGRNLDALDEVLGDLAAPTALVLASWTDYARSRPDRWERLLQVLRDQAGRSGPPLLVVLVD